MADGETHARAKFHAMTEGTQEDWGNIILATREFSASFPDRLIAHLKLLDGDCGGFAVDRLTHSLQTATRAHRDGRDEEYVACALIHDVGDILGPSHHAEVGAMIMKPFISERNFWMMEHHAIFQGYYYFHYLGGDRDMREKFRDHPDFEYTAQFCHLYDQNSFDPAYDTMPLEAFEPILRRVTAAPKRTMFSKEAAKA
jgi:predicted HD phosphohydrolase